MAIVALRGHGHLGTFFGDTGAVAYLRYTGVLTVSPHASVTFRMTASAPSGRAASARLPSIPTGMRFQMEFGSSREEAVHNSSARESGLLVMAYTP